MNFNFVYPQVNELPEETKSASYSRYRLRVTEMLRFCPEGHKKGPPTPGGGVGGRSHAEVGSQA